MSFIAQGCVVVPQILQDSIENIIWVALEKHRVNCHTRHYCMSVSDLAISERLRPRVEHLIDLFQFFHVESHSCCLFSFTINTVSLLSHLLMAPVELVHQQIQILVSWWHVVRLRVFQIHGLSSCYSSEGKLMNWYTCSSHVSNHLIWER